MQEKFKAVFIDNQKEKATTVTNYYLGSFKEDLSFQNRYLRYIAK